MRSGDSTPQSIGLRRRLGVLERAHSFTSHIQSSEDSRQKSTGTDDVHHAEETSGHSHSSLTDYESNSESSDSEQGLDEPDGAQTPVPEPRYQRAPPEISRTRSDPPPYPPELTTRAWYEFDLAVVVALVMPIGNWLTGGEHFKNVLVILLILFYLHQVIEIPWALYQKSRPRQHPPTSVPSPTNSKESHYHLKANSELRFYEILFFLLAAASPFLGVYTLRYLSQILSDTDILPSWFSTSLFILATGIRPWTHLVQRLNRRITDLHDIVHYPTPESSSETAETLRSELEDLKTKMQDIQKAFADLHSKFVRDTDEVYDYVDDAVEMVEKAAKKHERKCEKQEGRVKDLEVSLDTLKKMRRPGPQSLSFSDQQQPFRSNMDRPLSTSLKLPLPIPAKVASSIAYITSALPPWLPIPSIIPSSLSSSSRDYNGTSDFDPNAPPQYEPKHSPSATVTRYSILSLSSPDGLATIPEEMHALMDGVGVNGVDHNSDPVSPTSSSGSAGSAGSASSSSSGGTAGTRVSRLRGGHCQSHGYDKGRSRSRSRSRSPVPGPRTGRGTRGGHSMGMGLGKDTQLPPEYAKLSLVQRVLVRLLYIVLFPLREVARVVWWRR